MFYSLRQSAELLGVSIKTVRRMVERGDLEGRRIGPRLIKIHAKEIEKAGYKMPVVRSSSTKDTSPASTLSRRPINVGPKPARRPKG